MRSDWLIPICSGPERLKDDGGRKAHPTQKPEALLYRVILASTAPGDVVLDPFFGTGTTGAAAKRLGRHFIGSSRTRIMCERRRERIAAVDAAERRRISKLLRGKRGEARIPFGTLLDLGMISPGATLYDARRRSRRRCAPTVRWRLAGEQGSIHKMGARSSGPSGLQRLDILACQDRRWASADRRAAR